MSRRQLLAGAGLGLGALALPGPVRAALRHQAEPLRLAVARPKSPAQLAALAAFDDTHARVHGGIELLLWPGDRARLDALGIPHEITVDDVVAHDRARLASHRPGSTGTTVTQPGQGDGYRRLADHEADMQALAAARPDLVRLHVLPHVTAEGRHAMAIEIAGAVGASDGRPTFYMDGLHHAREWPSGELVTMFAHDLVQSYGTDMRITSLLKQCRVLLVPVVNPDGFHHSREAVLNNGLVPAGPFQGAADWAMAYPLGVTGLEGYWRKNRRGLTDDADPGPASDPAAYGVDPNRNYTWRWGGAGTVGVHAHQTYPGPGPLSEPESLNVDGLFRNRHVTGIITNHTYSDLILRPWGDTYSDCPDEQVLAALGDAMADHNGYESIKGIELYATTGTTEDHGYAAFGALAYTFEHGHEFHGPYGAVVPDTYARNREPFLLMLEAAADPAHHGVITGRTVSSSGAGVPGRATLTRPLAVPTRRGTSESVHEVPFLTRPDGTFEWHVAPSRRPGLANELQAYELTVSKSTADAAGVSLALPVERGEVVDLGRVVVP